jgi:hypothetical protein
MAAGPGHDRQAAILIAALLALTLNVLQPLAQAVLLRGDGPSPSWTAFCRSIAADTDNPDSGRNETSGKHECCLGLAHAPIWAAPSTGFILLPPLETAPAAIGPAARPPSAVIRGGPSNPRAPPFPV